MEKVAAVILTDGSQALLCWTLDSRLYGEQ